ncbi:hypothetical protein ACYG9Z_12735 [Mesorhizobium sp. RSR380A]|uniref:hypothetical protein n=1 Tax=unclassified Mesorhizobium TaxID=325217 RepID=UPI0003CEFF42|nr:MULTISPECIES: hypothetical protein [unclassified Mesorhizobium]ESY39369.1 hypothetical protein X746_27930 [Mesorhizobium sp. LNJC380A00]ESZ47119.1 hypothetical protein X730_17525 [Mesorhizobium sp. L103C565B0]
MMNLDGTLVADTITSLAALVGLLVVISIIGGRDTGDPLSRRFLFGLKVLAVLLACRILDWTTGLAFFRFVTITAAGLLPLAALLLTEGLLRRHAPFALKLFAAGGALLFFLLAPIPARFAEPWRMAVLLAFQFGGFLAIGWLVMTRDRDSLSAAENRTVERMALSLLLIIPFMVTDYRPGLFEVPVRLGGIAILFLCWLTIGLGRASLGHRDTIGAFTVITLSSVFAGLALGGIDDLGWRGSVQGVVIVLSATLLAVIYNDSVSLTAEKRRDSLLKHMAEGDLTDSARFLRGLQSHILVDGALILPAADLGDFDLKVLARALEQEPVRSLADTQPGAPVDQDIREQLAWLFEKFEATHVLLATLEPLTVVALNMPALASSPGVEMELRAVQRMAMLISQRHAKG